MPRVNKRKLTSQKNIKNARERRWFYRHQAQADQQQTGSSEQSSSEIVGNVAQHFPPLQKFDTHSFTFEAKPNLSKIETQSATPPRVESSAFVFNCSSKHASSEIGEIDFQHFPPPQQPENHSSNLQPNLSHIDTQPSSPPYSASTDFMFEDSLLLPSSEIEQNILQHFPPLQQSENQFSSFKPNLSHTVSQPNSPLHSTRSACSFKSSSEHLSSPSSDIVRNTLQQSKKHSTTSKTKSHIVPKPTSQPHSTNPDISFKSSSKHFSSSSPSSDILRNARQQSKKSTSKPNFPQIEPQPTSSSRSASNAFLGRANNVSNFESITTKCANCNWKFEDEIERNVKFNLLNSNNEIQIIDAIFSVYGLTVADWTQTLTSDEEDGSVFTYVSELVFEKGISFCSDCSLALQNVYTSHQTLKKFSHNESLFTKALNIQSSCKMQIKTEEGDENEVPRTNDRKTGRQETKEEENELEDDGLSCFEPMMEEPFDIEDPLADNLDELRPSSFTHFILANVCESHYDLSTTDVRPKAKYTTHNSTPNKKRRPPGKRDIKTEQKYLAMTGTDEPSEESVWSLREIKELNQKLGTDCFLEENLRDCFVRIEQMPPHPYGTMYSFNVFCCGKTFYKKRSFIRHKLIKHKEVESSQKLAKCGICERFISFDNIVKHMRTLENTHEKQIECTKCDMEFKHRCGLHKHFKTHDPNHVSWRCEICETHLISEYHSIVHKILKHSETPEAEKVFPCNKCESTFVEKISFKSHFDKHHCPAEDRTCKICDMVFIKQSVFYKHCKLKHNELISAKYTCELCNDKFMVKSHLKKHKEKNICTRPKRRFVCEKCGKTFRTRTDLRNHTEQHKDIDNPNKESFKCPICEKTLKHRRSLQMHLEREHPKEPKKLLYCEKCGKTTKNWSNMRIHMKVHEDKE